MLTPGTLLLTGAVVVLICGSKKLRTIGEDLGAAVKGFRKGLETETPTHIEKNPPTESNHPNH